MKYLFEDILMGNKDGEQGTKVMKTMPRDCSGQVLFNFPEQDTYVKARNYKDESARADYSTSI